MRTVILIPEMHAASELALNKILKSKDIKIVGIVSSNLGKRHYIKYGVRRSGLFYGAMIGLTAYLHIVGVLIASVLWIRRRRKWLTVKEIVKKHRISFYETKNINSKESIKKLKKWEPDLIVSLYFDQILKKEILNIAKTDTINMHPGILPHYKGLWSDFWKLYNKEKRAGVTVHRINEKIDDGEVLAQVTYPIRKWDTKFSLGLKSANKGTKLLIATLKKIKKGTAKPLKLIGKGKYYSLPTKTHFDRFHTRGKKLFSPKRFWKTIQRHL